LRKQGSFYENIFRRKNEKFSKAQKTLLSILEMKDVSVYNGATKR